jgi:hypothetical protein
MTKMQDNDLDRLLAQAASDPPKPSAALIDRVLADAFAVQPAPPLPVPRATPPRLSLLARLASLLGGAPALGAVSAAALFGITIGYLNPASLDGLASGLIARDTDGETEDFFPTVDFLTTEG